MIAAQFQAYREVDARNLPMLRGRLEEIRYTDDQLAEFQARAGRPVIDAWIEDNADRFDAHGLGTGRPSRRRGTRTSEPSAPGARGACPSQERAFSRGARGGLPPRKREPSAREREGHAPRKRRQREGHAPRKREPMTDGFGRLLGAGDRLLGRVENGLNLCAGVLIFALMLLGVVQIVLRTVFNAPIFGYIDVVEVSMVGFAVLSIAFVQRVGGHVRMEMLVGKLAGRVKWLVEALGTGLAGFIVAVLIPYSWDHFERAFEFGDSTIDIELATWPAKLVVPVALSVLLLRLVLQFGGYLRLAAAPGLEPVAVPSIKDAAERAQEEIQLSGGDDAGGRPT